MNAQQGNEVCSETIVIRSNDEWKRVVRSLRFDGERYDASEVRELAPVLRLVGAAEACS